jgi:hypothetical protein
MPSETLRPAAADELQQTLAHALQFDGREFMTKITAAHLAKCLMAAGFVVMKKPGAPAHTAHEPNSTGEMS